MPTDLKKYGLMSGELKLQLTKEEDVSEYPGRKNVRKRIETGFTWPERIGELPHMLIWGDMGSGKTHLLRYVRHKFKDETDEIKLVEFEFEPDDKSVIAIYRKIVYGLTKSFVKQLCIDFYNELKKNTDEEGKLLLPQDGTGTLDKERKVFEDAGIGEDLQSIIKFLVINQYDSRPINLAWKWFSAEKLSAKDKEELKVNHDTSNEADVSVRIAEIFQMNAVAYKGTNRIVIFADEVDQIDEMRTGADAVTALLRKMLESPSCSIILAATSTALDELSFMKEATIRRLLQGGFDGIIELPEFDVQVGDTNEVRNYVAELLKQFRPPGCSLSDLVKDKKDEDGNTLPEDIFPFTEKAITVIPEWCSTRSPEYALFPGRISDALTLGLQTALDTNKEFVDANCFT